VTQATDPIEEAVSYEQTVTENNSLAPSPKKDRVEGDKHDLA
jgi:hypothetical protein